MYLKPKRKKTAFAFLAGVSISLAVLAGSLLWMQWQEDVMREQIGKEVRQAVETEWAETHPMEAVYVYATDVKAGTVLTEKDLILQEVERTAVPADAVRSLDEVIGKVVRGDAMANMLCARSAICQDGEYPDDARIQEYSVIRLPRLLEANQTVDVRVMFPNGLDYVVLAKKSIRDLQRDETGAGNLVRFTVNEEELLRMSSAIVDAFLHPGTVMYAVAYVAPDIQEAAACTYPPNNYVQDLILANPNIITHAVSELEKASRKWFDAIPDPQPQQPLAVVPAPASASVSGTAQGSQQRQAGTVSSGTTGNAGIGNAAAASGATKGEPTDVPVGTMPAAKGSSATSSAGGEPSGAEPSKRVPSGAAPSGSGGTPATAVTGEGL